MFSFADTLIYLGRRSTVSNLYSALRKEYITEWRIWYRMHQVVNKKEQYYLEVSVCDDWHGPDGFIEWFDYMGPRPKHCDTISRKNKLGDFEPGNVEWTTSKIRNSTNRFGHEKWREANQIRKKNGISYMTYYSRLRSGWDPIDAATIPPRKIKRYRNYTL